MTVQQQMILALIEAVKDSGLTHFSLKTPGVALQMEAAGTGHRQRSESVPVPTDPPAAVSDENREVVVAPLVGVYYSSPSPGEAPFCQVGDRVKKGDPLCILEAMKVMNEITAPASGRVLSIEKQDGDLCEVGEGLLVIEVTA